MERLLGTPLGDILSALEGDLNEVCLAAQAWAGFLRVYDSEAADRIEAAVEGLRLLAAR